MGNSPSGGAAGAEQCEAIGARLEIAGRSFRVDKQLGEGGFSYVFRVLEEATVKPFALKRILAADSETAKLAEQEVSVMKLCTSRNIIGYKGHAVISKPKRGGHRSPVEYLILMEYCPGGTLTQFLADQQDVPLSEAAALLIALDVASAVRTLHTQTPPICHRDLKLDNVLLGADRVWRLCDFGSATTRVKAYETKEEITLEEELIQQFTTPSYRAPEMANLWLRRVVGPKADIWALGCIFYTIVYLKHPFQNGTNSRAAFPSSTAFSAAFIDLIRAMLTEDPEARPNIIEVVDYLSAMQRGERPRLRHRPPAQKTPASAHRKRAADKPERASTPPSTSSSSSSSSEDDDDDETPAKLKSPNASQSKNQARASTTRPRATEAPAVQDDLLGLFGGLDTASAAKPAVPARNPAAAPATDWIQF